MTHNPTVTELKPCRECGARCQPETFGGTTVWLCSNHAMFGGDCPSDTAYLTISAWNTRASPIALSEAAGDLGERLSEWKRLEDAFHDNLPNQGEAGDPSHGKALCQFLYDNAEQFRAALSTLANQSEPAACTASAADVPGPDEIRRVTAYLARAASDLAWQAGVGGMETAGSFVSYLAANPEKVEQFISGAFSDLPPKWHVEGCLSWHGMDGKIHRPDDIRKQEGRHEH